MQGRACPWQGLRDLQEQPALQGAPALRHLPALPGSACVLQVKGRRNAAFCRLTPGVPASASVSRPDVPPRPRAGFGIRAAWPESAPPGVTPCPVSAAVLTRPGRNLLKRSGIHLSSLWGSPRSEEHTSELQSLMRNSYAVFCLKKKTIN